MLSICARKSRPREAWQAPGRSETRRKPPKKKKNTASKKQWKLLAPVWSSSAHRPQRSSRPVGPEKEPPGESAKRAALPAGRSLCTNRHYTGVTGPTRLALAVERPALALLAWKPCLAIPMEGRYAASKWEGQLETTYFGSLTSSLLRPSSPILARAPAEPSRKRRRRRRRTSSWLGKPPRKSHFVAYFPLGLEPSRPCPADRPNIGHAAARPLNHWARDTDGKKADVCLENCGQPTHVDQAVRTCCDQYFPSRGIFTSAARDESDWISWKIPSSCMWRHHFLRSLSISSLSTGPKCDPGGATCKTAKTASGWLQGRAYNLRPEAGVKTRQHF